MPRPLLITYVLFYVFAAGILIIFDFFVPTTSWSLYKPLRERISDAALFPIAMIGMMLLLKEVDNPSIKTAWKPISILLAAGQTYMNVRRLPPGLTKTEIWVGIIGTVRG